MDNEQPPAFTAYQDSPAEPTRVKHSGLGIASLIIAIVMFIVSAISLVAIISVVAQSQDYSSTAELQARLQNSPAVAIGGLGVIFAIVGHVVGLILGIIGLVLKGRKKVFAIIGTVLNGVVLVGLVMLMLLGLAAQGM